MLLKCVSGTQYQYMYTSVIHQMAFDAWHKYHTILVQKVSFLAQCIMVDFIS